MADMTLSEGMAALKKSIAEHMEGTKGSLTRAASEAQITVVISSGQQTRYALAALVAIVASEYTQP